MSYKLKKGLFFRQNKIKKNQRAIIQLSKSISSLALNPVPVGHEGGHIEHYYHFIFDLLLPLNLLIKKTSSDVIFSLNEFGVLAPILYKLFSNRILIQSNFDELPEEKIIDLIGMNPVEINIHHSRIKSLKETICAKLNIQSSKKPNKIILIERLPPSYYYLNNAQKKGSGASRRSITNHIELEKNIRSKVSPNYEFHNLKLENMSFEDQIKYFDSAVAVIGQHGAGLANIIWMPKKSIVIEFGFKSKKHFEKLSSAMKHSHFAFDNSERHIEINCAEFSNWLTENKTTRHFFLKQSI